METPVPASAACETTPWCKASRGETIGQDATSSLTVFHNSGGNIPWLAPAVEASALVWGRYRETHLAGVASWVLSQSSIFGQNPKIWCQEFNDLQTLKLSKKQAVYLSPADKYHRLTRRLLQGQKGP